jgi:hypothetical protein
MNWSPQSSRDLRAWAVLRQFRAVLVVDLGNVAIDPPAKKTFEAEDAILERTLKSVYPIGRLRSKSWRTRLAGESTGRGRSSRKRSIFASRRRQACRKSAFAVCDGGCTRCTLACWQEQSRVPPSAAAMKAG